MGNEAREDLFEGFELDWPGWFLNWLIVGEFDLLRALLGLERAERRQNKSQALPRRILRRLVVVV